MLKSFTFLLLSSLAVHALGQNHTRGYIGIGVGASHIVDHSEFDNARIGLNLTLLNFGYSIYKGLGVTAAWIGSGHITEENHKIGYGALMAGPMYTFNFSDHLKLDLKFRAGRYYQSEERSYPPVMSGDPLLTDSKNTIETSRFSWSAAVALREHFARHWLCFASLDVFGGDFISYSQKRMLPITLSVGIGFGFGK